MIENISKIRRELAELYPDNEIEGIIRIIFEHLKGWSPVDIVLRREEILSEFISGKIDKILFRLKQNEPIQYIIGEGRFFGYNFIVNRSTLIPRHETEELVEMIIKENSESDLSVLDIGTGSGCIAIALAMHLRFPDVTGIDISEQAIMTATENAKKLKAAVKFKVADIFSLKPTPSSVDIIVSNPPYICESESVDMEAPVLDYEPHSALFVPDSEPLIFYNKIADYAITALKPSGKLYFEINPIYSKELVKLLNGKGFSQIELHLDIHKRRRFATAIKI